MGVKVFLANIPGMSKENIESAARADKDLNLDKETQFILNEETSYIDKGYKKSLVSSSMYKGMDGEGHKIQMKLNLTKMYQAKGASEANTPWSKGENGEMFDAWASNIFVISPDYPIAYPVVCNWVQDTSDARDHKGRVIFKEEEALALGLKKAVPQSLEVDFAVCWAYFEFSNEPIIINGRQVYTLNSFETNQNEFCLRVASGHSLTGTNHNFSFKQQPTATKQEKAKATPQEIEAPTANTSAGNVFA